MCWVVVAFESFITVQSSERQVKAEGWPQLSGHPFLPWRLHLIATIFRSLTIYCMDTINLLPTTFYPYAPKEIPADHFTNSHYKMLYMIWDCMECAVRCRECDLIHHFVVQWCTVVSLHCNEALFQCICGGWEQCSSIGVWWAGGWGSDTRMGFIEPWWEVYARQVFSRYSFCSHDCLGMHVVHAVIYHQTCRDCILQKPEASTTFCKHIAVFKYQWKQIKIMCFLMKINKTMGICKTGMLQSWCSIASLLYCLKTAQLILILNIQLLLSAETL